MKCGFSSLTPDGYSAGHVVSHFEHFDIYLRQSAVEARVALEPQHGEGLVGRRAVGHGVGPPRGDQVVDAGLLLPADRVRGPAEDRAQVHLVLEWNEPG